MRAALVRPGDYVPDVNAGGQILATRLLFESSAGGNPEGYGMPAEISQSMVPVSVPLLPEQ